MEYWLALNSEDIHCLPDPLLKGVGMIRGEYLFRYREEYVTVESCRVYMSEYVAGVCKAVYPSEVWYRTSELIGSEINVLAGADAVLDEAHESLGLRGIRRGLRFPDTYLLELETIAALSKKHTNLHLLFPFVTSPWELEAGIRLLREAGHHGKYGMMAEIPSAILLLEKFLELGVSNVTVGINDLTTFTLAAARSGEFHDPCHPAVVKLIGMAARTAHEANVPIAVAGAVSRGLGEQIASLGVNRMVVHYMDLPEVLGTPEDKVPMKGRVSEIKALTRKRRLARERAQWRERLTQDFTESGV